MRDFFGIFQLFAGVGKKRRDERERRKVNMDMPIDFYGRKVGNQFMLCSNFCPIVFRVPVPDRVCVFPSSGSGPGLRLQFEVGTGGSPGQHTSTAYCLPLPLMSCHMLIC